MGIYKAYDIRGIYPDELDEKTTYKIGRAVATFLASDKSSYMVGQTVHANGGVYMPS